MTFQTIVVLMALGAVVVAVGAAASHVSAW